MLRICLIMIPMTRVLLSRFKRKSHMAVMSLTAQHQRPNLPSWLMKKAKTSKCTNKTWAQTRQMTSKNRTSL